MKRIMLALCLLLSTPAFAEEPYYGAWTVPNGNFATFIQKAAFCGEKRAKRRGMAIFLQGFPVHGQSRVERL